MAKFRNFGKIKFDKYAQGILLAEYDVLHKSVKK